MTALEEAIFTTSKEFPELRFVGEIFEGEDEDRETVAWTVCSPSARRYLFYPISELLGQNVYCLLTVYLSAKDFGAGLLIRFNGKVYKFELIDIYESKPTVKPFEGRNALWFSIKLGKNISKLLHPPPKSED